MGYVPHADAGSYSQGRRPSRDANAGSLPDGVAAGDGRAPTAPAGVIDGTLAGRGAESTSGQGSCFAPVSVPVPEQALPEQALPEQALPEQALPEQALSG